MYDLRLPAYPGTASCVRIGGSEDKQAGSGDVAGMRQSYDKGGLSEEDAHPDAFQQFDRWLIRGASSCHMRYMLTAAMLIDRRHAL